MKKIIYILSFLFCLQAQSQINLVPNSSFETFTNCPTGTGQIDYTGNWYQPTTGTPDYFNSCFSFTLSWTSEMDVPNNYWGNQSAFQNLNAYAGLFAWYPYATTYREYLQTKLTTTLTAGQKYYVSMYISLSDSSRYSTDDLGIFLSQNAISRSDFDVFTYTPQITNIASQFQNDKTNWKKISGSFIASGNEEYITIGNFKDDANTDTLRLIANLSSNSDFNGAYYYIDGVCVSTDSLTGDFTTSIIKRITGDRLIYYNNIENNIILDSKLSGLLKIYDGNGKIVYSVNLPTGSQKIDVSQFNKGIYFISIYSEHVIHKKIYIN